MKKLAIILSVSTVLTVTAAASACPMCKDTIAENAQQEAALLPSGLNASIYLMLGSFLGALGLCGGVIAKAVKAGNSADMPASHL